MRSLVMLAFVAALAVATGCSKPDCSGGEACRGSNGDCMSCSAGATCNSGGNCSSVVNGVACCTGGGGGGGGSGCGCGTLCNSNGICCPRGYYGCRGSCYASSSAAMSAGCASFTTCCP